MANKQGTDLNASDFTLPEFNVFDFKDNLYSQAIANEQVKMLFGYCQLISVSNSLFAALFVVFMWDSSNHFWLLGWLFGIVTISSLRWLSGSFYQKMNTGIPDAVFWKKLFMLITIAVSLAWGFGSVVFSLDNSVNQQYLIALFIFGLGSLGLSIYSVVPKMMYALLIPSMLPFTILMAIQEDYSSRILAVGLAFSFLFFTVASRRTYKNIYENIYFRLKEAEQKEILLRAKQIVEKSSKAKSEFLSRMSHELRTPLNAILGFGQMLELDDENMNKTQKGNVSEILNAGQHLLNLINEVLDLSRIEAGKLDIKLEPVCVQQSLNEAIALIRTQTEQRDISIDNCITGLDLYVYADAMRLKQVFVNLLSNAVKYNQDKGRILLNANVIDHTNIKISIADTGHGLTEQEINLLFVPFDRLNAAHNVEGTGIGLVITQHLVSLMNGKLDVSSTIGKGSVFSVELPLTK